MNSPSGPSPQTAAASAAVIGYPISHSRSPVIFAFLCQALGITEFDYSAIEVKTEKLEGFLKSLRGYRTFKGVNVTIPHKEALLPFIDTLSKEAKSIGAVNVVDCIDGKLHGRNTDYQGVIETLREHQCAQTGQHVLVFGAGGAARATLFALGKLEAAKVILVNRSEEKAKNLAKEFGLLFPKTIFQTLSLISPLTPYPSALNEVTLVINSTSVGLKSTDDDSAFDLLKTFSKTSNSRVAFDLIYNPPNTPFLKSAKAQGFKTLPHGGLDMLIYQALETWRVWMGHAGAISDPLLIKCAISRVILAQMQTQKRDRIALTGFMGVGKSFIGKQLAQSLGWEHVDTDAMVEDRAGATIPQIFQSQGENAFRALESQAVNEALKKSHVVLSLGGGALKNPESLNSIQSQALLVYLKATPETLCSRLGSSISSRPLLANSAPTEQIQKIQSLLSEREATYLSADLTLQTDGRTPERIVQELHSILYPKVKSAA